MSFYVTVTPTIQNVEVEVNPQTLPFEVEVVVNGDLKEYVDQAEAFADQAEASAISAENSADSALASATSATASANSASSSASSASNSASTATTQAGIATTKANEASQSASNALASEQASAISEANALASEQNALASEQSALASANTATSQAGIATTKAGEASASASSALASQNSATASASTATTQAGIATTQASNALASANAAAASAASAAQVGTSTLLTGFSVGSNTAIAGTDTILQAFNKTQGQINARVSGTGTSGQVAFWNGTTSQTGSNNLFWDNVNGRLGIGTNSPTNSLQIGSAYNSSLLTGLSNPLFLGNLQNTSLNFALAVASNSITDRGIFLGVRSRGTLASPTTLDINDDILGIIGAGHDGTAPRTRGAIFFRVDGAISDNNVPTSIAFENGSTSRTQKLVIFSNGNVVIQNGGTFTNAGFRLDVAGSTRIVPPANTTGLTLSGYSLTGSDATSAINISGTWNTTGTPTLIFANVTNTASNDGRLIDLQVGGVSQFLVRRNGLVGIASNSTYQGFTLALSGGVNSATNYVSIVGSSSNTTGTVNSFVSTNIFQPTSGTGLFTSFFYNGTINQTGGANGITRGLFVNPTLTSAADWRSIEWSNNTGWGLYGIGTAPNYLNGNLLVGSTNNFGRIYSSGATSMTDFAYIFSQPIINNNATNLYSFRSNAVPNSSSTITNYYHYDTFQSAIGSLIINNQFGYRVNSNLTGATNNYGFYGDIASGTNRWNLYMNGTASNYLRGNLLLNTTTDAGFLLDAFGDARITGSGNTSATTALTVRNSTPANLFRIQNDGILLFGSSASGANIWPAGNAGTLSIGGNNLTFYSSSTANDATFGSFNFWGTTLANTSGTLSLVSLLRQFAPTSGNAQSNYLIISPTINQTGGANGITRGLLINPTLTSAADWRSIEWSNNTGRGLWGTGTADNAIAGAMHIGSATVPNTVAQLEVSSTTKGFLPPRMTTAQRDLIAAVAGLVIYNTTTNKHQGHNGTAWQDFY